MHQLDQKKLLIERIVPYLTGAPSDVVQRLLQKSVSDLGQILYDAITNRAQVQATEHANQYADEMRRESQQDGAWTHALRNVLNGKQRLVDCESNKSILESLLQPTEEPSGAIYSTIVLSYPMKFSWETPQAKSTPEDQRKAFDLFVRENNLSSVDANFRLFQQGASIEGFAGASQFEKAAYAEQGAVVRQKWLVNGASPTELRAEARHETQTQLVASQQAQADATLEAQKQRDQYAGYKALPAHIDRKALINASKDELRKWSRLYGQFQLNTALRGQQ
jgi:hypothetical protein